MNQEAYRLFQKKRRFLGNSELGLEQKSSQLSEREMLTVVHIEDVKGRKCEENRLKSRFVGRSRRGKLSSRFSSCLEQFRYAEFYRNMNCLTDSATPHQLVQFEPHVVVVLLSHMNLVLLLAQPSHNALMRMKTFPYARRFSTTGLPDETHTRAATAVALSLRCPCTSRTSDAACASSFDSRTEHSKRSIGSSAKAPCEREGPA